MFRSSKAVIGVALGAGLALAAIVAAPALAADEHARPRFGFGKPATAAEIAGWDIDVRPDGHGIRKGRGTVRQGQAIYDAQCASCHGTFGESNNYMVLAGGVAKQDLASGRASSLLKPDSVRTVGTKLNHATTLWDYINRAMPWTAPQSLTVDEVYAVTAYVLNLNEIVPIDFELSDRNLLEVKMPNRNGMTTAHGLGSVRGKPDVQGTDCMHNCKQVVVVLSELPDYAMNAHGNLAQQVRSIGALAGIDTRRFDSGTEMAESAASPVKVATVARPSGKDLVAKHGCVACHGVASRIVGPSFGEVKLRHEKRPEAAAYLAGKIRDGGLGAWGQVPMPAQPGVPDSELRVIAEWILQRSN